MPPATASPSAATPPFVAPRDRSSAPSAPPESSRQERSQNVKQRLGETFATAEQETRSRVEQGRGEVAGHIGSVGRALQDASHKLKEEQEDAAAEIADRVGRGFEKLSDYIERRDTGELLQDAKAFARNHPGVFLGGAALIGFTIARFLRSAEPDRPESVEGHWSFEPGEMR